MKRVESDLFEKKKYISFLVFFFKYFNFFFFIVKYNIYILNLFVRIPKGKTPRFPKKPTIKQEGDNLILECILEADPLPDITWYLGTKKIKDGKRHKIQQKSKGAETYLLTLEIKVLLFCLKYIDFLIKIAMINK